MIKNVNLMQNPQDIIWDKESEYSREHLIQALANLGQRIGIKGDGISYNKVVEARRQCRCDFASWCVVQRWKRGRHKKEDNRLGKSQWI